MSIPFLSSFELSPVNHLDMTLQQVKNLKINTMKTTTTLAAIFFSVFFMMAGTLTAQNSRPVQTTDLSQTFLYNTDYLEVECMLTNMTFPQGTQFVWSFGDGNVAITGSSSVQYEYAKSGVYPVTVTIIGMGESVSIRQFIQVNRKVYEVEGIYLNPSVKATPRRRG